MSLPDVRLQIAAITLAEELNFTRTAERLKITQPALSKQIAEVESRLGFAVFIRDQKRVALTEAGQVFVRGCRDSLALIEKAVRTARAIRSAHLAIRSGFPHPPKIASGVASSGQTIPLRLVRVAV